MVSDVQGVGVERRFMGLARASEKVVIRWMTVVTEGRKAVCCDCGNGL